MKDDDILLPETSGYATYISINEAKEFARETARINQKQEQETASEPRAFCLEAAKRGEPLVTRDGRKARFLAHVPEALPDFRVLAMVEGDGCTSPYRENGSFLEFAPRDNDLFLAPKPKRTVWVNVTYTNRMYDSEAEAREIAEQFECGNFMATAVPIQIDDVWGKG